MLYISVSGEEGSSAGFECHPMQGHRRDLSFDQWCHDGDVSQEAKGHVIFRHVQCRLSQKTIA